MKAASGAAPSFSQLHGRQDRVACGQQLRHDRRQGRRQHDGRQHTVRDHLRRRPRRPSSSTPATARSRASRMRSTRTIRACARRWSGSADTSAAPDLPAARRVDGHRRDAPASRSPRSTPATAEPAGQPVRVLGGVDVTTAADAAINCRTVTMITSKSNTITGSDAGCGRHARWPGRQGTSATITVAQDSQGADRQGQGTRRRGQRRARRESTPDRLQRGDQVIGPAGRRCHLARS